MLPVLFNAEKSKPKKLFAVTLDRLLSGFLGSIPSKPPWKGILNFNASLLLVC